MTRRTKSHVIADKATAQIADIITDCGFSSEVIHHDYGEDLMVQTKWGDDVDPNKVWIQVKGTEDILRFKSKAHGYSLRVSLNHAFHWVRASGLVVVILWDVVNRRGYWSLPRSSLSEMEFRLSNSDSIRLRFSESREFDAQAMNKIAWTARIDHYQGLLAIAKASDEHAQLFDQDHKSIVPLITMDFLKLLNIIVDDGLDPAFLEPIRDKDNRLLDWNEEEDGSKVEALLILGLLNRMHEIANLGLPGLLLDSCSHMLGRAVAEFVNLHDGSFTFNGA